MTPGTLHEASAPPGQADKRMVAQPWFERLGRYGYATKGMVYLLVGALTAQAAFGLGGDANSTSQREIFEILLSSPVGRIGLIAVAIGLIGYVLLRLAQALLDAENKGRTLRALVSRVGYFFGALVYLGMAATAVLLVLGFRAGDGSFVRDWAGWLLGLPFGAWLLGIAGAIVLGVGLFQFYRAYARKFIEDMRWEAMGSADRVWVLFLGRVGLAACGIVQILIGVFLMRAAFFYDPAQVQTSQGALLSLAQPPFGRWAVGLVAAGLAAYGVYTIVAGRYSRICAQEPQCSKPL